MKRRIALKQLGLITAGAMLMPGCVKKTTPSTLALKHLTITGDQEGMIAEIAETIIPGTDIPGAKQMNLQSFILKMVDDCQDTETQQKFQTGLKEFEEKVKKKFSKPFAAVTPEEKKSFLLEIEEQLRNSESVSSTPVTDFYALTKRYTIQGFANSEYVMTNVHGYKMIPGKFVGCVQIKDTNDIQTVMG